MSSEPEEKTGHRWAVKEAQEAGRKGAVNGHAKGTTKEWTAEEARYHGAKGGRARGKALTYREKAAHARKAGLIGGPARASALSPERRREIAKMGADARVRKLRERQG
jgi:hypothetical protein